MRPTLVRCLASLVLLTGCPEPAAVSDGLDVGTFTAVEIDPAAGALLGVWGSAPDDVWTVGGQAQALGDPGEALVYRRRSGEWSTQMLPAGTPLLNWIHGSESTVWTVGNAGAALRLEGDAWVEHATGLDVPLWGCFVLADDDVWAVGGDAFDLETPGVILRWDGAMWTEVALPELDADSAALFKVWAAGPDQVWAVGDGGVILYYDGQRWAQQASGTNSDLISLWGTGPDEIVAVGGRSSGAIVRYDGSAWTAVDIDALRGLNGVWMHRSGDAALVGNLGGAAVLPAQQLDPTLETSGAGFMVLHGTFGFESTGTRIAVGGTLDRSPPYEGVVFEIR